MQPLISIIIPTFNRSHLLGETLESIIAQTFQNWECLVIDDGSTDRTKEILEFYQQKDHRVTYHLRPKNKPKGANACRNYGFEISKGNFINWFDDDDLMHPKKLELQVKKISIEPVSFCVCKTQTFEGSIRNSLGLRFKAQQSSNPLEDYLKMKIGWMTPSSLWKREALENFTYLFDEKLMAAQEWEFHSRALALGHKYFALNEVLDFIRKHEDSITYQCNEEEREWYYFIARLKIYRNKELHLGKNSKIFLRKYLLDVFKQMIRSRNPYALNAFSQFIIPERNMTFQTKCFALVSLLSYRLWNKGNTIHQKIKYAG